MSGGTAYGTSFGYLIAAGLHDGEIRVLRIGKDGVRLGVTAPPDVPVHRGEIYDQIRVANVSAASRPDAIGRLAASLKTRTTE